MGGFPCCFISFGRENLFAIWGFTEAALREKGRRYKKAFFREKNMKKDGRRNWW